MATETRPESIITFNHLEEERLSERGQEKVSGRMLMMIDVIVLIAIISAMLLIF